MLKFLFFLRSILISITSQENQVHEVHEWGLGGQISWDRNSTFSGDQIFDH